MDSDFIFLYSIVERFNVFGFVIFEVVCQDKFNAEFRDNSGNFVKIEEILFEIQGIDFIVLVI